MEAGTASQNARQDAAQTQGLDVLPQARRTRSGQRIDVADEIDPEEGGSLLTGEPRSDDPTADEARPNTDGVPDLDETTRSASQKGNDADSGPSGVWSPGQKRGFLERSSSSFKFRDPSRTQTGQLAMVRRASYQFDGCGSFHVIPWTALSDRPEVVASRSNTNLHASDSTENVSSLARAGGKLPPKAPQAGGSLLQPLHESSSPLLAPTLSTLSTNLRYTDSTASAMPGTSGGSFLWFHLVIPRTCPSLAIAARQAITFLHPPLPLQHVVALLANGPFCSILDGALLFRINSPGPLDSPYSFKIAVRMTKTSIVSLSLGDIPRLELTRTVFNKGVLSPLALYLDPHEPPSVELGSRRSSVTALDDPGPPSQPVQDPSRKLNMPERANSAPIGSAPFANRGSEPGRSLPRGLPPRPVANTGTGVHPGHAGSKPPEGILSPDRVGLLQSTPGSSPFGPQSVHEMKETAANGSPGNSFVIDENVSEVLEAAECQLFPCLVCMTVYGNTLHDDTALVSSFIIVDLVQCTRHMRQAVAA